MEYSEGDLVRIAKRENNTKRNYLVVDPLQGKHIPVSPTKALQLFADLAETLRGEYNGERLLLVGFAETATAIGAQAAVTLGAKYMNTTREPIPGVEYLFFSEEHSHATEQKLVKDDIETVADSTDRIIFIEDEVTTGKTILNIITILDRMYPNQFKYSVASLLNGMQPEHLAQYAERGIRLHYLVKTDHSGYIDRAECFAGDGAYYTCEDYASVENNLAEINQLIVNKLTVDQLKVTGAMDTRRLVDAKDYEAACEHLADRVVEQAGLHTGKKVLVVGTEECMYPALFVGRCLERKGYEVRSHSTTRSPIAVSSENDYPLHCRYELKSLYDAERRTFIYDIGKYDEVFVVTDARITSDANPGLSTLLGALSMHNSRITVVRWC